MQIKKMSFLLLFVICLICGCAKQDVSKDLGKAEYAVIRTSALKSEKTQTIFLDADMNYVGEKTYDFGNVGGCGFNIPYENNDKVYDISLAYGKDAFPSKVLEISMENWECSSYDFDRTNITDLVVTDSYVYAISNLNAVTYIDRCPIGGGKDDIDTIEIKDETYMELYNVGDKVFVGEAGVTLHECNFEKKNISLFTKIKTSDGGEPVFSEEYGGELILAGDQELYFVSAENGDVRTVDVPKGENEIKSLFLDGNFLYVSRAELHMGNEDTMIIKYDLDTNQVVDTYKISTDLMQFQVKDNNIIIISEESIIKYSLERGGKTTKIGEYQAETKGYRYVSSGFFVEK